MKESFNYENHTDEIKSSLNTGARCVGIIFSRIVNENEDIYKYAYREMKRSTNDRIQQIRESLKGK